MYIKDALCEELEDHTAVVHTDEQQQINSFPTQGKVPATVTTDGSRDHLTP